MSSRGPLYSPANPLMKSRTPDVCIDVCVNACMYVCIYACLEFCALSSRSPLYSAANPPMKSRTPDVCIYVCIYVRLEPCALSSQGTEFATSIVLTSFGHYSDLTHSERETGRERACLCVYV